MSRSSVAEPPAAARRKQSWTELADRVPTRREAWLAAIAAVSLIVFYLTKFRTPGILVWANYACGITGTLIVGFLLAHLVPLGNRVRWGLAVGFAVALAAAWIHFDHFQHRWKNDDGDKYSDWVHRWSGKVTHRTLWLKQHTQSSMMGPMSGDPEKPHGRWQETYTKPSPRTNDAWFWYGKRITQGEWELHNRR
jgi:hypothetical protein